MTILIDDPTTAGDYVVVAWIARTVEDGICIDEQGDAGPEMERRG
jgi:hypothetical protein